MFGTDKIDELIKAMNSNNEKLIQSINLLTKAMEKKKPKKKTPESIAKEQKCVNWAGAKTPQQQIMKFWVFNYLPESYKGYTHKEFKSFIGRYGDHITSILDTCRGDVNMVCKVITMIGKRLSGKGLDWTLKAVDNHCADHAEEIRRITNASKIR